MSVTKCTTVLGMTKPGFKPMPIISEVYMVLKGTYQ